MMRIVGLAGSLRQGSYNAGLLRAAAARMPDGAALEIATIAGIPLYDGDVEKVAYPDAAATLKNAIAASDGLLLATPEYNNSLPGVFKNAIDWCSRPHQDAARVFRGKKIAIIGASTTGFGTILAQEAWLPVFRALEAEVWTGGKLMASRVDKSFDDAGNLVDGAVAQRLSQFLAGFLAFIRG